MSDAKRSRRVKSRDNDRRQARQAKRQMRAAAPVPVFTPAAVEVSA